MDVDKAIIVFIGCLLSAIGILINKKLNKIDEHETRISRIEGRLNGSKKGD